MVAASRGRRTAPPRAGRASKAWPGNGTRSFRGRRAATARPEIEYSPCRATAIAQDRLEPILRDKAIELGADVRLSTELIEVVQSDDGVTATVRQHGGHQAQLRAQYLVAADGARSPVREALGIGRSGQGLLAVQRSLLFRAPLEELPSNLGYRNLRSINPT